MLYALTQKTGANLYILPPCYQATSYGIMQTQIDKIERELNRRGLPLIAHPKRYLIKDELCYDSIYHPNKIGADIRTALVIEDLQKAMKTTQQGEP